jgi:hypothetical protein
VLDLLDAGGDPLVVQQTPGWQLQEVDPVTRYAGHRVRGTGRVITAVAECFDELVDLDAGPKRLAPGEILTTLAPLTLSVRGTGQQRPVDIAPGTRLELTEVYAKGHAECRALDAGDEILGWIEAEDEGRLFRRG